MADTVDPLILDLLEWLGTRERPYQETLEVWRTSCPKLPVWEEATDRGLVGVTAHDGALYVSTTPAGQTLLHERRPDRAGKPAV